MNEKNTFPKTRKGQTEIKKYIKDVVSDLALDFVSYDRKEDEELPRGVIENLISDEVLSIDELVEWFKAALVKLIK